MKIGEEKKSGLLVKTGAEKAPKHKNTTLLVKTGAKSAAI